jgi:hypothetical protein
MTLLETPSRKADPVLPGHLIARLADDVDNSSAGLWQIEAIRLPDLTNYRVRVGGELVRVAQTAQTSRSRPKVVEHQRHRLTLEGRDNWRHRAGEPIRSEPGGEVIGHLMDQVEPGDLRMKVKLDAPDQLQNGNSIRIAGEVAVIAHLEPVVVTEELPGRQESYPVPALRISERGLGGLPTPHYAGEALTFVPDRPVVIPGPAADAVEVEADSNSRGRLMITTPSEPRPGQLAQVHFGEALYGASVVILAPEAADDGESLAGYALASGPLTASGFGVFVASSPRPKTRYWIRFHVVS